MASMLEKTLLFLSLAISNFSYSYREFGKGTLLKISLLVQYIYKKEIIVRRHCLVPCNTVLE